jgi:hypothetical protein
LNVASSDRCHESTSRYEQKVLHADTDEDTCTPKRVSKFKPNQEQKVPFFRDDARCVTLTGVTVRDLLELTDMPLIEQNACALATGDASPTKRNEMPRRAARDDMLPLSSCCACDITVPDDTSTLSCVDEPSRSPSLGSCACHRRCGVHDSHSLLWSILHLFVKSRECVRDAKLARLTLAERNDCPAAAPAKNANHTPGYILKKNRYGLGFTPSYS